MQALLVSNPYSTASLSKDPQLAWQVLRILTSVRNLHIHTLYTHYAGHAEELCRGVTRADADLIIILGGDGTVSEVLNGLLGPVDGRLRDPRELPRVAVIPTGSANVFARALGMRSRPLPAARQLARLLRQGSSREISLGTWQPFVADQPLQPARWFAVNAGFGVDAEVIHRVERARSQGVRATPLRYLAVSVSSWLWAQYHPPRITVEASGPGGTGVRYWRKAQIPLVFASNTNPWTFLGPLPVVTNPQNSFDLGLGLFALERLDGIGGAFSMANLVGLGHSGWSRRFLAGRVLRFDDAHHVSITCSKEENFQVDGEFEGRYQRVELGSSPAVLEVVAPLH